MYSDEDSLDKLRRGLYSREGTGRDRRPLSRLESEKPVTDRGDWEYKDADTDKPETEERPPKDPKLGNEKINTFFLVSAIIFALALGFVIYKFFFATDIMSPKRVVVTVDGPATVNAGSEVFFDVLIENTNKSDLLDAKLTLEFPENTLSSDGDGARLERATRDLGKISAGESVKERFGASLFGKEGESVTIEASLEYGTEYSSGRLSNEVKHNVTISSSPVLLLVAPSANSVQSRNEFEIEIDVSSNTQSTVNDVLVVANYPSGFTFVSANPSPISEEGVWNLGSLKGREVKSITLRGYLEGLDGESKYFSFDVGSAGEKGQIGRLFGSTRERVDITAPPLALEVTINGNRSSVVSVPAGERAEVSINWRNQLNTPLNNLVLRAEIDDRYIDKDSVDASSGFYQSAEDTVVWNQSTDSKLGSIGSRDSGMARFVFRVLPRNSLSGVVNPEIPIRITVTAFEPQPAGKVRKIENSVKSIARVASSLEIAQELYYQSGPFSNSGPLPPKAESETTYTVRWFVSNAGNATKGTTVRAALPANTQFVKADNQFAIRYNELTNEIVWNIGEVKEGAGLAGDPPTISFQVRFLPSRSQVGSSPVIIREAVITGSDTFSGANLKSSSQALTTKDLRENGAGDVVR